MIASILLFAAAVQSADAASIPTQTCVPVQDESPSASPNANKGSLLFLSVADRDNALVGVTAKKGGDGEPQTSVAADYVRLKIEFQPCGRTDERDYSAESRWWGKRMFMHKLVGKVLNVTATVNPLGVSASKTLSSVGFDSGDKGQTWTTDFENDSILLPYFRADAHAVVKLDITFSSTREYQGAGVAGTTLDIVKRAASLISPTSSLVTKENIGGFNDAASFVDTTINGLLKVAVNENVHLGIPLDGEETLATLTLYLPPANDPHLSAKQVKKPVGQWKIVAQRLGSGSIFQLAKDGNGDAAVSAAAIMNFRVSDEKTLKAALTGSNSVQVARDALLNADESAVADAAMTLCRATAVEADAQGFSYEDTGKVVWAYLTDLALPTDKRETAQITCNQMEFAWNKPSEATAEIPTGEGAAGGRR